jgi:hypothetical protein
VYCGSHARSVEGTARSIPSRPGRLDLLYRRSKLSRVNEARAEWRRRLLLWNRWFVVVLVAGFVLFSLVFTIVLIVMGR